MKYIFFASAFLALLFSPKLSNAYTAESFRSFISEVKVEAREAGVSEASINKLNNIEFQPTTIRLDRKQPESVVTFERYMQNIIPTSRVNLAKKHYNSNKAVLKRIESEYGVPAEFIVALWAIESNFGENMGNFPILDSLATLAYEGRRRDFFKKELILALKMADSDGIDIENVTGSWAGAMGQTQFMPSSFLKYATDGDNDGDRDIWNSKADAFASIANYLSTVGWNSEMTWGRKIKSSQNVDKSQVGWKIKKPLSEWKAMGFKLASGKEIQGSDDLITSVIYVGGNPNHAYIAYPNFHTILDWNKSSYFAVAVGTLADKIAGR